MTVNDTSLCPDCGGFLKRYDKVQRIVRTKGGEVKRIYIQRFRCTECHKIHRIIPDCVFPYKHYESKIIKGVRDGNITSDTLGYEDYPCEMTMKRWTRNQ